MLTSESSPSSPPEMQRLAVLGWPISHSKSPRIHTAAYRALDLPWHYSAVRVGETALARFLAGRDETWRGFSVTMPLKEEAFRSATVLDHTARESGVVNTLLRLPAERGDATPEVSRWAGFNTDVFGLAEAVRKAGLDVRHSVVLGAGATAISAVLALRRLGAEHVTVVARRAEAASAIAQKFHGTREAKSPDARGMRVSAQSFESLGQQGVDHGVTAVISTLPGPVGTTLELPSELLRVPLFDVAYAPWPSPLANRWRVAGSEAHAGLAMLVEQALMQIRIFVSGDAESPLAHEEELLDVMHVASVEG